MGKCVHILQLRLTMQFNSILYSILYLSSFCHKGAALQGALYISIAYLTKHV